jgi:RNA polymerase sigma factor (sigma-70 family)
VGGGSAFPKVSRRATSRVSGAVVSIAVPYVFPHSCGFHAGCHIKSGFRHYYDKCMTPVPELIDQVALFHEDAFAWAVACCAGDVEVAADAMQECYIKVASGRANFAGRSSLKTWWLAVIRFTVLEQRRGHQRWRRVVEVFRDWVGSLAPDSPVQPVAETSAPPETEQLATALDRLPPRQREVLHLVFQNDLSVSEAAAVMGVSVGSARQHYERAKKRLRQELTAEASEPRCDHAS